MEAGPALLVASGYVGAISGAISSALAQLGELEEQLPPEFVAALLDTSKAHHRMQKVLEANIAEASGG